MSTDQDSQEQEKELNCEIPEVEESSGGGGGSTEQEIVEAEASTNCEVPVKAVNVTSMLSMELAQDLVCVDPDKLPSDPPSGHQGPLFQYPETRSSRPNVPIFEDVDEEQLYDGADGIYEIWKSAPHDSPILPPSVIAIFYKELGETKNPFAMAYELMIFSTKNFSNKRRSSGNLAKGLMYELKKWKLEQEKDDKHFSDAFLSPSLQAHVFEGILHQRRIDMIQLVFEIFEIPNSSIDLLSKTKELCSSGNYLGASLAATTLGLQDHFDIHDFVIPLILQDREVFALEYLDGYKSDSQQEEIMKFFDGAFGHEKSKTYFREYAKSRNIADVVFDKLEDPRPLGRLMDRLALKFSINTLVCVNATREKRLAVIRHLMYKMYKSPTERMSEDALHEMLDCTSGSEPEFIHEIMIRLHKYGDNVNAAKFGIRHNYPLENCSYDVQLEMSKIDSNIKPTKQPEKEPMDKCDISEDENSQKDIENVCSGLKIVDLETVNHPENDMKPTDIEPSFYKLPHSNIHFVNTLKSLDGFLEYIKAEVLAKETGELGNGFMADHLLVGMDCEWQPLVTEISSVSIIQLAVHDQIFLVDIFALKNNLTSEEFDKALQRIKTEFYGNEKILKIGFAFESDIQMLCKTPAFLELKREGKSMFDLQQLAKELGKMYPDFYPYLSKVSYQTGLTELVLLCTGTQLYKGEQYSDWEKRPLREAQVNYAAADACCLLDIFETIKSRALDLNINLNQVSETVTKSIVPAKNRHKKRNHAKVLALDYTIQAALDETERPILRSESPFKSQKRNANEVKFVCDTMFQGLGRHLRVCGFDTRILENNEPHTNAAKYCLEDNRYLITAGKCYKMLVDMLPHGHSVGIVSGELIPQIREVLAYFNLYVTNDNIFTFCQMCNSNEFIRLSRSEIFRIGYALGYTPIVLEQCEAEMKDESKMVLNGALEKETWCHHGSRYWTLLPESELIIDYGNKTLLTKSGKVVSLGIPPDVLETAQEYHICASCGKLYWFDIKLLKEEGVC